MYLAPLLYLVLAWIVGSIDFSGRFLTPLRPLLIAYLALAFGLMSLSVLTTATGARTRIETRRGVIRTHQRNTVIEQVQAHTAPGEKILVYPYLPLYYYLTATRSPSRYDYFQPGMNTPEQAQEIIGSLKSQNVPIVLFEPWFPEKFASSWPGTPWSAIAHDPVADGIVTDYRLCRILSSPAGWQFDFMLQKRLKCP
jgi:hypothetical protein